MTATRRGNWTVTALNGAVAGIVLVLVAVLALVVNPPAPPGIAAFAPQASKPITKAPQAQSAQFGNGSGACGEGQTCAGPSPTASASAAAAASSPTPSPTPLRGALPPGLQCYSWPDGSVTQTFDPQSPPCISRWDDAKGNGGATAPGVTATEIKIAYPVTSDKTTSTWPGNQPFVDFFNTRYQFYGRKITIVPVHSQQSDQNTTGPWNDPVAQRADAAAIRAAKPFATMDFMDPISESSVLPLFYDAMAKARIVTVAGGDILPLDTAAALMKRAPYAWSYYPTVDQLMDNVATMTCRQLVGRNATHAPDTGLRGTKRKFAMLLPSDERLGGPMPGLGSFLKILDGCGVHDLKVVRQDGGTSNQAAMNAAMQQLKLDGVTSVFYLPFGGNGSTSSPMAAAQQVTFRPEWITNGWYHYNTAFVLKDPSTETAGAFGVGVWNKQPAAPLEFWSQALGAVGATGSNAPLSLTARPFYQELMLIAAGIQMAGPNLTAESFAAALHSTEFPNPGAGQAPFFQGAVGFPGDSPTMVNDYNAFWLDTRTNGQEIGTAPALNTSKAFCFVGLGRRWGLEDWPTEDRFYTGACR